MVYFGSDLSDDQRMYNKSSVDKLPPFTTKGSQREGATFIMDEEKNARNAESDRVIEKGSYTIGEGFRDVLAFKRSILDIGKGADIPIGGWFTSSRIAVVEWTENTIRSLRQECLQSLYLVTIRRYQSINRVLNYRKMIRLLWENIHFPML